MKYTTNFFPAWQNLNMLQQMVMGGSQNLWVSEKAKIKN
jgi:hypothetical protein